MNQGKIVVGVAVVLGICAGLAGYWWNYRIGHRALAFWGQENARLIRLAPTVRVFDVSLETPTTPPIATFKADISQARGLIHLRNAILSDDQFVWDESLIAIPQATIAIRFNEGIKTVILYFDLKNNLAYANGHQNGQYVIKLGPLAKSLEQFLARELPRAEQEAAAGTGNKPPVPAKSE